MTDSSPKITASISEHRPTEHHSDFPPEIEAQKYFEEGLYWMERGHYQRARARWKAIPPDAPKDLLHSRDQWLSQIDPDPWTLYIALASALLWLLILLLILH